ncbi:hypothetical protein [Pseudoroseicyclus sp. CXY001]|uniref:hypothetical protein n=1 Tax=Pseudoroseicyclus sp. CXY001 TaxID=3242492 RepID=UPI003570D5C0
MRPRWMVLCGALAATPAMADVTACTLTPNEKSGLASAELRIFHYEDFVHSIVLEARTEYGDDLPYLFVCETTCAMEMKGDLDRYRLTLEGAPLAPERVVLETEGLQDDFTHSDIFDVEGCRDLP